MHWYLVASFVHRPEHVWLMPFAQREGREWSAVPSHYALDRSRSTSALAEWRAMWAHTGKAWQAMKGSAQTQRGMVTVFPQLAMTAAVQKRLRLGRGPIVAWCFNVGALYEGAKGLVARRTAQAVDTFVVHSRAEIEAYSRWLQLPSERFQFAPLQRPTEPIEFDEDLEQPFVLSMGSAKRDYALLVAVMKKLGLPTLIVAADHALAGIDLPPNVTVRQGLTAAECARLAQRARLSVVPVANRDTASGQVTVIDAMMFGRATIATRCIGTVDYIDHGVDGWLVEPGSQADMAEAIETLWHDDGRRNALGAAARERVSRTLSDPAGGQALDRVLRAFE